MSRKPHPLLSPHVLMLVPVFSWAANAVIGRAVAGELPPFALSFWRWVAALLILLPFGLSPALRRLPEIRRNFGWLLLLALTSVTAYNTLLYLAAQTTTAINITLVASAMPTVILLLSWAWLGERIGLARGGGVVLAAVGVLAVIARGDWATLRALEWRIGDAWMLVAVLSWSVYTVLLRRRAIGLEPMALLTVLVALGVPFIFPLYAWEMAQGLEFAVSPRLLAVIGFVGLFPSVLAYYCWNVGVATLGPGTAGLYSYLVPVVAAALAMAFLGESFQWFHAAGMALIFAGVWLASWRR